ncbi:AAA family ATPase [Limnochorda pilosa]|uniref:ATPase AAA n=1 Tax=Limnochorda pilosa TaxID=1555112 RepID=A0A0K2SPS7_LIMPI|nr:AAA family ATPase [Limnochorda pilosa]BAS29007.1 ATPase AAA [Limnochorda pilosa]
MTRREVVDNLTQLLECLPPHIRDALQGLPDLHRLIEIVLDLGRQPEARFPERFVHLSDDYVTREDLQFVVQHVGQFGSDNRAGIERTLHRISAIRNRRNEIIGLTCRIGRAVFGTIDIIRDVVETGESLLLLGRPGIGKTTMLREMARVLADEFNKRVVIVDTSNEIAGDGDIPHPAIGRARRMQVSRPDRQAEVMIEAVENHMPEVIVIDEIGTEAEAMAARTIAERGVQLIGTAHGNTLDNLVLNPTLSDLVGGIQAVTLGDEEAKKRGTQKTVLERKAPPTFDIVVEIQEMDRLAIHHSVASTIDQMLRGLEPQPEVRERTLGGSYRVLQEASAVPVELERPGVQGPRLVGGGREGAGEGRVIRIFPYAVSRTRLERAVREHRVPAELTQRLEEADLVLTLKGQYRKMPKRLKQAEAKGLPVHTIRSNTLTQVEQFVGALESGQAGGSGTPGLPAAGGGRVGTAGRGPWRRVEAWNAAPGEGTEGTAPPGSAWTRRLLERYGSDDE